MSLPENLTAAINTLMEGDGYMQAAANANELSRRYRQRERGFRAPLISGDNDALAYLLTRMPATYHAVYAAIGYMLEVLPDGVRLQTLLDAGAGTGAASWAACAQLGLESVVCLENVPAMRRLGERLSRFATGPLKHSHWLAEDITTVCERQADLVIASYVLNELSETARLETVRRLWTAAGQLLLLIEPGTPDGYRLLCTARDALIAENAHILAPCPHTEPCPLSDGDWCHFTTRVPRSKAHKRAKNAEAPYEDEKFSYLAFARFPAVLTGGRVLRHPARRKGHIGLSLCGKDGLSIDTITRSDGPAYARAKKANSGDLWLR